MIGSTFLYEATAVSLSIIKQIRPRVANRGNNNKSVNVGNRRTLEKVAPFKNFVDRILVVALNGYFDSVACERVIFSFAENAPCLTFAAST